MDIDERLDQIDRRLGKLEQYIAELKASNRMAIQIIKFVVLPLIVILGGLVGIKLL